MLDDNRRRVLQGGDGQPDAISQSSVGLACRGRLWKGELAHQLGYRHGGMMARQRDSLPVKIGWPGR